MGNVSRRIIHFSQHFSSLSSSDIQTVLLLCVARYSEGKDHVTEISGGFLLLSMSFIF
jgi:hypothetical protein